MVESNRIMVRMIAGGIFLDGMAGLIISRNGKLPLDSKADMKFFREATQDSIVVMGRKTWETLPKQYRPLSGRINVILSNEQSSFFLNEDEMNDTTIKHFSRVSGPSDLLSRLVKLSKETGKRNIWIMGGKEIYEKYRGIVSEYYITAPKTNLMDSYNPPYNNKVQDGDVVVSNAHIFKSQVLSENYFAYMGLHELDDIHGVYVWSNVGNFQHYHDLAAANGLVPGLDKPLS